MALTGILSSPPRNSHVDPVRPRNWHEIATSHIISENSLLIHGFTWRCDRSIRLTGNVFLPSLIIKPAIPGGPKNGTADTVDFSELCPDQQLSFFTLLNRASFSHYNTKIIKFGWEFLILWVISYGLSFSGFARFPEFRGTINDSFSSTCASTYQHSTSYKEISVPMTCLDCKFLLGNTRITEHNTRSIHGRPKLSLIVPRNSGNRANPENDSP